MSVIKPRHLVFKKTLSECTILEEIQVYFTGWLFFSSADWTGNKWMGGEQFLALSFILIAGTPG